MTINQIKAELLYFYEYTELAKLVGISKSTLEKLNDNTATDITTKLITDFFNTHCDTFSIEATLPNINQTNKQYLVDTPDGYQLCTMFITKPNKPCVHIIADNGCEIQCADEHLIQLQTNNNTDLGWVMANTLKVGDIVDTKPGITTIKQITRLEVQDVYDFSVNHSNHRYWAGGFSNHNTGKSLFVQKILANAQKEGLIPVIFDTENSIDATGATRLGLDISKIKYVPCVTIEQTRNAIFKFLTAVKEKGLEGKFIVAIDSLGNLQSELELSRMDKESTSSDMGSKARAIKSLMQTCTNFGAITRTTIICTNHVYDDPTAMYPTIEKMMPGGKSVIFLPSVTVQLARKPIKDDGGKTNDGVLAVGQKSYSGIIIRALTRKNRFIKQYLEGEMYLSFASGLDKYYGLLDLAVGLKVIIQTGATYTLENGTKLGYAKSFRKDTKLWEETILPVLESRIAKEWNYSNIEEEIPLENTLITE